jgi:hypothetical protein
MVSDFELREEDLKYETLGGRIRFYSNPQDPGAYDLLIDSRTSFYIPDRTLEELARGSTEHMVQSLTEANRSHSLGLSSTLQRHSIRPEAVHIGICQLYIKQQEELDDFSLPESLAR